jgi:hypothetical protein
LGPANDSGEARSENTGSVNHQPPRSFISKVEWPRRYRLRSGARFSSVVLSGKTGSALPGSESAGLLKKNFHSVPASGLGLLAGRGCVLRKRPPEY